MIRSLHARTRLARALTLGLLAVCGCALHAGPPPVTAPAGKGAPAGRSASSRAIERAAREMEEYGLRYNIGTRVLRGLPLEDLPDLSLEGARRDAALGAKVLAELAKARVDELTSDEIDSLGVLRFDAQGLVEAEHFYWLDLPITPYQFPLRDIHQALAQHPFANPADAKHYLGLLEKYARWISGVEALVREKARRGRVLPAVEIPGTVAACKALPTQTPGPWRVAPERLAQLPAELRQRLPLAIEAEIRDRIAPALQSFVSYLEGDYARAAPGGVGLAQYAGGIEYYRWLVRRHTTLELSPEEIHQIGLDEMARIQGEMEKLRLQLRVLAPLPEFRASLRTDPRFFAKSAEEVGAKLLAAQERMTPKIPSLFGRTPKAAYGVERLSPALEGAMTFGYYDPPRPDRPRGLYYFNGSQLDKRSTLSAAALIYHELAPGHHFQIALQRENELMPAFRRESFPTAFTEGWGEYASGLAAEVGLYDDPYDHLGRLMMESFLAARLVVDTGMNALGWNRQQAMDYMAANTLQSPEEIATETLRYSCDIPGQALAYKLGARAIQNLRSKAQSELGSGFDVRRFHDEVLAGGALPLKVLERRIERFIASEKARTNGKGASQGAQ